MTWATEIAADSPRLWYRMDDTTKTGVGSLVDSSGAGLDGAYINGSTIESVAGYTGDSNDGSNFKYDDLECAALAGGYITDWNSWTEGTIEVICNLSSVPGTEQIIAQMTPARSVGGCLWLKINNSTGIVSGGIVVTSGATYTVNTSGSMFGVQRHIVLSYNASTGVLDLYIDGSLADSDPGFGAIGLKMTSYAGTNAPQFDMFYIGARRCASGTGTAQDCSYINGVVDEVLLYDTPLSSARVAAHAAEMTVPDTVNLSVPIFLNTVPRVRLFAPIRLKTSESVTLNAPINLNTRAVALSAEISLQTSEEVSLSAPINVVSLTSSNTNRATGKWSVAVYVDGTDVSARLTGTIEIEQGEDISSLAFFTILPESGTVTPANYIGNRVRIDFIDIDTDDNVLYQLTRFVGFVSDPLYDPATGELYMQCTSDLQGTLDNVPRSYIDALTPTATWSPYVFDEGAQGWDYASDRMRTIPGSMWHGPSGIVITNWAAKTTADFEFTDDEMFECGPYAPGTRRDLLNTINASFDFRYKRKRQRTLGVKWETMQTFCSFLINGFTLCQRRMVESAASGAGWVLQGDIQYIDLPPAGYYTCFPFASGGQSSKVIGWGNLTLGQLNEDPDNQALCWGASWRAAKRWAQTVTEHYTIVMSAAQSVAGNGEIGSIESYRLETSEDFDEWVKALDYSTADPVTDGYEDVGGGQADGDYILGDVAKDVTDDTLTGRTAANTARAAIIASGTSDILSAHRQNQATLVVPFQPQVNPTHTVRAVSAHITFKGKIGNMRDVWDIDTGDAVTEITVALSRHEGTGLVTPSPLTPEDPPEKTTEDGIQTTMRLLTYVGGRNDVAELTGDEQGYFTNWIYDPTETEPFATDPTDPAAIIYPEEFVVEYPEVSGGAVDAIELPATQNIDVEIPVDELTLTQ